MGQNESNNVPAEQKQASGGCSCGCGGGKGADKVVVAVWVIVLLAIAVYFVYTHMDSRLPESERLLNQAYGLFEKQDFEASTECLRKSAELGNAWAQLYYGGSLKKGVGTAQDMPAAVEWFRKSAAQNCAIAFYELGVCYENGEGVERNLDEAETWYKKALDAGIKPDAQEALDRVGKLKGEAAPGDPAGIDPEGEAVALYKQAIELFDRQDKDVECAALLRQSAELGYVWAQLFYGRFLCKGIGTALAPSEAVGWFRKAADQDCPAAYYELGVCYENGEGVERDLVEAEAWYRKAVDGGFEGGAQHALDRIAKTKADNASEGR
jgi:hypothetical protein